MGRIAGIVIGGLVLVAGLVAIYGYTQVNSLEVERVTDGVRMISGLGSNVGVLTTDAGPVIVDSMTFRSQGDQIRSLAEELVGGPTQAIVNTHYHLDHTHGNPAFAPGTKVVATQRTRELLDALDAEYWQGAAAGTAPNDLFEDRHELRIGGKTIRSYHMGRGHTGGDLVVLFVEDRVLHTGDLVFNNFYPGIDLEGGGSVVEWNATLDRVLELDFDYVIPGHGPVTDREGIRRFQRFIRQLAAVGADAAREGRSLEDTIETAKLDADRGFEVMAIPFVMRLDRDFVIQRAWEEATGAVTPIRLPSEGAPRP